LTLTETFVAGNHILRRHHLHHHPEIDLHKLLHDRNQQEEPRALHTGEAAEREHDAALVFAQHANGLGQKYHDSSASAA